MQLKSGLEVTEIEFIDRIDEGENTYTFNFSVPDEMTWTEGTHFHLAYPELVDDPEPNKQKVRSFSVMRLEEEGQLSFTTRINAPYSDFKKRLLLLTKGDKMIVFKIGNRMGLRYEKRPLVLISMGVAIATFRPHLLKAIESGNDVDQLIHINIDKNQNKIYQNDLDQNVMSHVKNIYVDHRQDLYKEIDGCLESLDAIYYLSGSDEFLQDLVSYLRKHQVADSDIVIDKKAEKRAIFFEESLR